MKVFVFVALIISVSFACQEHKWGGRKFWCCPNGTKFEEIWSDTVPLFCKKEPLQEELEEKRTISAAYAWFAGLVVVGAPFVWWGCGKYLAAVRCNSA